MREELSERFLEFAAKIIELGKELNQTYEGRHIYGQLFRSATSLVQILKNLMQQRVQKISFINEV